MPIIKPVSDLRNYAEVLHDIKDGEPVFLTKNGRGKYVIMDLNEYEKIQAILKLFRELEYGEKTAVERGWKSIDEVAEIVLGE